MTSPQQHDDPLGEARGQILQALAVLATIGESAARFAATGAQNRAAKAERGLTAERTANAATQQADRITAKANAAQDKAARQFMDQAFDNTWLDNADLRQAATLWRTASLYAMSGDRRATEAMRRAQQRLHQINPVLMDAYHRHRQAGLNMAQAMRAAAYDAWRHQSQTNGRARPHGAGGDPPPGLRAGANGRSIAAAPDPYGPRLVEEMEQAVRVEVSSLADGVDPDVLDVLQRQWRGAGHAPAADAATQLAQAARARGLDIGAVDPDATVRHAAQAHANTLTANADTQRRAAVIDGASIDNPVTSIDEHHTGVVGAAVRTASADHDVAAAGQQARLGRAFPPLHAVSPIFSHAPAPVAHIPAPTQRKGSVR